MKQDHHAHAHNTAMVPFFQLSLSGKRLEEALIFQQRPRVTQPS